jgi:hypothetical protein
MKRAGAACWKMRYGGWQERLALALERERGIAYLRRGLEGVEWHTGERFAAHTGRRVSMCRLLQTPRRCVLRHMALTAGTRVPPRRRGHAIGHVVARARHILLEAGALLEKRESTRRGRQVRHAESASRARAGSPPVLTRRPARRRSCHAPTREALLLAPCSCCAPSWPARNARLPLFALREKHR